jgi:AbrB family looped-hinge helix DNA binding protein
MFPAPYNSLPEVRNILAMPAATLTSKGQITLPKTVRDRLQLGEGDRVEFVETADGYLLRAATADVRELKGILSGRGQAVTIEEMNSAISQMGQGGR